MKPPGKKALWALAIITAVVAFVLYIRGTRAVVVGLAPVERRDLDLTVTATSTGTVKSDTEVKATAQRTGMISELFVVEGDVVRAGDKIAELDRAEVELNLKLAEASAARIRSQLAEARSSLKALAVDVQTGVRSAEARLADAKARYESQKALYEKGYISKIEFTSIEKEYDVARASREAALAGNEKVRAKEDEVRAQEAALREAEERVALERLNHGYSSIASPVDGIVTSLPVKRGETVARGSLVAVVITTGSLYIEAFIDEADIERVKLGQPAKVTMDAYPDRAFEGRVYKRSPVVIGGRLESRTFEVRTRLDDAGVALKPGMSADVEIVVDSLRDALVAPSQAVVEREGKKYIYVNEGGRARPRAIEVGLSDWTYTQVVSGLRAKEEIVTTPDVPGLKDGARVKARD
jgi:HlyD family secretion protein